jgi:hypothetical protein
MACVDLPVTLSTPILKVAKAATALGLKTKEWNEVVRAFDALSAWSKWLTDRYGENQKIVHRSNPDDPPDLTLVFEGSTVGVEHSVLYPPRSGKRRLSLGKTTRRGVSGRLPPWLCVLGIRPKLIHLQQWGGGWCHGDGSTFPPPLPGRTGVAIEFRWLTPTG